MRMSSWIALVSVALASPTGHAVDVWLVKDGSPQVTIVLQAGANDRLKQAAEDLQSYVNKLSGVELPITRDGQRAAGPGLYIGSCITTTESDLPAPGLNPETYAVRVRDGDVYFTGRWPTPACFAVYSLLEEDIGIRWFAPGELWEHLPPKMPGELRVSVKPRVTTPGTSPRVWSGHAWWPTWKAWNLRNKTVLGEVVPRRQFQNFLHRVFPTEKYAESHPEYYPLINGKRWIPSKGNRYWRPCESNPEVIQLTAQYARTWFDERPNADSFSVGMDDISHLCSCPSCRAWDPVPDAYENRLFSDRHYRFVNAIAREIRKTHPDRYVGTLIYNIARQLPKTVDQLEDNVFGFITETSALWWQPGRKDADRELTRQWAKRCKHLSRYDYYGMGTFTPRTYPHVMDEQMKFDKSLGLEGMYIEVYTFLPHTAPMIWALAKLQWDHTLDIDELLGDFYGKMYGRAAGTMRTYFDLLERSWNTPRPARDGWVHRSIIRQALAMGPKDVDAGTSLLDTALKRADSAAQRRRIEIHRAALTYSSFAIKAYALSERAQATVVDSPEAVRDVLEAVDEVGRLAEERDTFWAAAHDRKDLLGETIRGLGDKMGYLQTGKVAALEKGALAGAMRALAWLAENDEEQFKTEVRMLLDGAKGKGMESVRAWLWVQDQSPPSLLKNGDFETTAANEDQPEKDWRTEGAPNGWSVWSRTPRARFATTGGEGKDGSAAATVQSSASACYLQTVKAQPGDRFLCIAWTKCYPLGAGHARLGIRFRDAAGNWHKRRDLEPTVMATSSTTVWQPLVAIVTVPEGGGSILVMPGAEKQKPGGIICFDDVALYKLPPAQTGLRIPEE